MFTMPTAEELAALDRDALSALLQEALAASAELSAVSDDDITDEQLDALEELASHVNTIEARDAELEVAAQARADRLAAARAAVAPAEEAPAEEAPAEETPAEETAPADEEVPAEKEPVLASGARRRVVARAAAAAPAAKVATPAPEESAPMVVMTAAANLPTVNSGHVFDDFSQVAEAFSERQRGFGGSAPSSTPRFERFGVAKLRKPENEFTIDSRMGAEEQMSLVLSAAKESRLPKGGLIAAGGWCAPSETFYDGFLSVESVDGILSIPEITVRRGGINFTKGPDYAALAADWGFLQTEAQAEAGTEKVCYEIDCPDFQEVRLDAIGFCIKNGILTNVGYPELTRRVLEIGAVAHAHKVNAQVITRISNLIGAATNYTEIGSATSDILDAIAIQATVLRYQYAMAEGTTIEAVFPIWAKEIFRADLSRRNGVDMLAVTDAQIQSWLGVRNISAQWVYDWQNFPVTGGTTGQAFPTTLQVMLYPAGAFVKGTTDVIDLDTVYDSVGLSTNTYTAAFFEEGLLVANTGASGRKVEITLTGRSAIQGLTGAAILGTVAA